MCVFFFNIAENLHSEIGHAFFVLLNAYDVISILHDTYAIHILCAIFHIQKALQSGCRLIA